MNLKSSSWIRILVVFHLTLLGTGRNIIDKEFVVIDNVFF